MQDVDEMPLQNGWICWNLSMLSKVTLRFLHNCAQSTEKSMINCHQLDQIITPFENLREWSESVPTLVDPLEIKQ
jgi:hypothetical protein